LLHSVSVDAIVKEDAIEGVIVENESGRYAQGERVEKPQDIRGAFERAVKADKPYNHP